MTTTTIDLTHPTQVVSDRQVAGLGHRAECGCGWASDWTDNPADAETAGVDHREVAAGPGDGLDVVMSELLDLQDGLAVAASMTMLVRRRAGLPAGALAGVALLLGLGASLAANVAAAEPTVQGRLVAAWPPLGLLLSYELLMQQIKARGGAGVQPSAPVLSTPSNGR